MQQITLLNVSSWFMHSYWILFMIKSLSKNNKGSLHIHFIILFCYFPLSYKDIFFYRCSFLTFSFHPLFTFSYTIWLLQCNKKIIFLLLPFDWFSNCEKKIRPLSFSSFILLLYSFFGELCCKKISLCFCVGFTVL